MRILQKLTVLLVLLPIGLNAAPNVAVSIAPVHSLVTMVLEGVDKPDLILPSGQSPHTFSLTPSSARKVLEADLVIYVSNSYEIGLSRMLENIAPENKLALMQMHNELTVLPQRRRGRWQGHDHDEDHEFNHGTENEALNEMSDDHSENLDDRHFDPHLWLSPDNAINILLILRDRLSEIDPANQQQYLENTNYAIEKVGNHSELIRQNLEGISHQPYLVFHDAFQYFESSFDLHALGSVTLVPEQKPGARRISELRKLIKEEGVRCIFSEPQFEPRMVNNLTEDLEIARGELDPLGAGIGQGSELWFTLTLNLTESLNNCLN